MPANFTGIAKGALDVATCSPDLVKKMSSKKPKILLIDDELINIKILADILKDDYEVVFAASGPEGIRLASESIPDLILLDVMMPEMDGYEVCAQLQKNARTAAIPVIFVTALGSTEHEVKGLDAGAIDYLTKPVKPAVVQARLRNQLEYKNTLLATANAKPEQAPESEALSSRQKEIYGWVQAGKTNWEIARIIGCSEDNVKYHMKKILRIFGSYSRTQVAARHVRIDPLEKK